MRIEFELRLSSPLFSSSDQMRPRFRLELASATAATTGPPPAGPRALGDLSVRDDEEVPPDGQHVPEAVAQGEPGFRSRPLRRTRTARARRVPRPAVPSRRKAIPDGAQVPLPERRREGPSPFPFFASGHGGPAEVGAPPHEIDLVAARLPVLGDEQPARPVPREPLRVPDGHSRVHVQDPSKGLSPAPARPRSSAGSCRPGTAEVLGQSAVFDPTRRHVEMPVGADGDAAAVVERWPGMPATAPA